jgi:chemotaxis protein MotB
VLSAARSASVVHYLAETSFADPSRIEIRAFADTQPIAPNNTAVNRAKNRRIEINLSVTE